MNAADLIAQARRLTRATTRKSRQIDLKRGVTNAYYAMFHTLAKESADAVTGQGSKSRPDAWLHVYRSLEHGMAKSGCEQAKNKKFPNEIVVFAEFFPVMQQHRHDADYNPRMVYAHADVVAMIDDVERAIASLASAPRPDRRAFVALVLLPSKRRR